MKQNKDHAKGHADLEIIEIRSLKLNFRDFDKDVILKVLLIGDAFAHQFKKQSALYETASALRGPRVRSGSQWRRATTASC